MMLGENFKTPDADFGGLQITGFMVYIFSGHAFQNVMKLDR